MPYLGNPLAFAYSAVSYQDLTGVTGSPVKRGFTLNNSVLNANELEVFVNNVRQEPSVAYTAAGTTLTMTGDVETTDDFYVVYQGMAKQTVTPAASTNLSITDLTLSGELALAKAVQGTTLTDTSNTGSVTLDFDTYQNFVLTLTGNVTLANPTTEAVGQVGSIVLIQDGTGSRTLSLGTDYESVGGSGITLSTAASATDMIPYVVAASNRILLGTPQLAFS
tara:strand:- start:2931 stop:3596 length:666 start_codon:yes stop_codon:yes gene_type:complete